MSDELICSFCSENLNHLTLSQREDHYEAHFVAAGTSDSASAPNNDTARVSGKYAGKAKGGKRRLQAGVEKPWKKLIPKIENDVFWYPSVSLPQAPPRNYTPGLIPILKRSLTTLAVSDEVRRAALCHDRVVHIAKEFWDAGWGCGYRCFLMLCTGLLQQEYEPLYSPLLDAAPGPSIRNLQSWIQAAWDDGFDVLGRDQLRNRIIRTRKWIGTADIYVALSWRGIPAQLVDVTGFRDKASCATAVVHWMVAYFTPSTISQQNASSPSNSPVLATDVMPVILQYLGHSIVIVGYQEDTDGTVNLLTFDSGRLLPRAIRNSAKSLWGQVEPDAELEGSEPSNPAPQTHKRQQVSQQLRQLTLAELLTPSEIELANSHSTNLQASRNENNSRARVKIISHRKGKGSQTDKRFVFSASKDGQEKEVDARKVLKAFRLTAQELATRTEYQILYVPKRPPLTESERMGRKVVNARRITGSSSLMES